MESKILARHKGFAIPFTPRARIELTEAFLPTGFLSERHSLKEGGDLSGGTLVPHTVAILRRTIGPSGLSLMTLIVVLKLLLDYRKPFKFELTTKYMAELRDGDYMKGLLRYCDRNLSRGYTIDQIRLTLLQQGYSRSAVDRAIKLTAANRPKTNIVEAKPEPKIVPIIEEPVKKRTWFQKLFGLNKTQFPSNMPPEF